MADSLPFVEFELIGFDDDFEPLTRNRSNTWPSLPKLDIQISGAVTDQKFTATDTNSPVRLESLTKYNCTNVAEKPESIDRKRPSRKNAWGPLSYAELITQAINSSIHKRLTLSEIYDWMVDNVPYFKDKGGSNSSAGWKNSIRHNLSLHNRFIRVPTQGIAKSSWWMINPDQSVAKTTRRRAASMEAGKFERKRGRSKMVVDLLKSKRFKPDLTSSPGSSTSSNEDFDFCPGTVIAEDVHLYSTTFRPRASSCVASLGKLSPIQSTENEPQWQPVYSIKTEQFTNDTNVTFQVDQSVTSSAPDDEKFYPIAVIKNKPEWLSVYSNAVEQLTSDFNVTLQAKQNISLANETACNTQVEKTLKDQQENNQISRSTLQAFDIFCNLPPVQPLCDHLIVNCEECNNAQLTQVPECSQNLVSNVLNNNYTNNFSTYEVYAQVQDATFIQPKLHEALAKMNSFEFQLMNEALNEPDNCTQLVKSNSSLTDITEIVTRELCAADNNSAVCNNLYAFNGDVPLADVLSN